MHTHYQQLFKIIEKDVLLTEENKLQIAEIFQYKSYKKNTLLIRAGEVAHEVFFLLDGLVHQYYIDENGNEIKANIGRFGPYLQIKTKYYSLKTDDPYTVELPRALEIIKELDEAKEKATIKVFEKEKIQILIGQYGAYIKQGRKNFAQLG